MLRNLSIRARLLVLLAVPLALLLAAAAVLDVRSLAQAADAQRLARTASAGDAGVGLVTALQQERLLSVRALAVPGSVPEDDVRTARAATDSAAAQLTSEVAAADLATAPGAATARALARTAAFGADVSRVRAGVDDGSTSAEQALTAYDALVPTWSDLSLAVAGDSGLRDLAQDQQAAAHLLQQAEAASREQVAGVLVLTGTAAPSSSGIRATAIAEQGFAAGDADALLSGALADRVAEVLDADAVTRARAAVTADRDAFTAAGTQAPALTTEAWLRDTAAVVDASVRAADVVAEDVAARAEVAAAAAVRDAVLVSLAALLVLAAVVLAACRTAGGLARRLQQLTRAATDVREELPRAVEGATGTVPGPVLVPVPVTSTDEVGRAQAALNELNEATFRIAGEQAALRAAIAETFVNVARRDQSLLARQLAFLDQLERGEEDPDVLEDLFTLDHLATRMRRNAESLLVLAGVGSSRRLRGPLPLSDVVRTAAGEIEHYDRVDLALRVDPPVVGHLALSLAHLLAELLENATTFSDPGSRVLVDTAETARGVEVSVTDTGLGMTEEELATARERLRGGRTSELAGAQRLGFYVVGRLAGRLDVEVDVTSEKGRGTTVTLVLGASLFTPGSVRGEEPETTPDLTDPAASALPPDPVTAVAGEDLARSLARSLDEAAAEAGPGPVPGAVAPGRRLPRRRGADPAAAATGPSPAAPFPAFELDPGETPYEPLRAESSAAPMPRREPRPLAMAAAQDILPRAGRRVRTVRPSPVPPRTAAEAFWTARHRRQESTVPEAPVALAAAPAPEPAPAPPVASPQWAPPAALVEVPLSAPAESPAASPAASPAGSPASGFELAPVVEPESHASPARTGDALRQRSALAAEALSALTEGQPQRPGPAAAQPLARRQAGAAPAAARPAPARPASARQRRAPADVRSMLSGFQAGVSRGRAEAHDPDDGPADTSPQDGAGED